MNYYLYILLLFNTMSFAASINNSPELDLPNLPQLDLVDLPDDITGLLINSLDMSTIREIYQTNKFYRDFINNMIEKNRLSTYLSWAMLPIQENNLGVDIKRVFALSSDSDFLIAINKFDKLSKFDIKANKKSWEIDDLYNYHNIVLDHTNNLLITTTKSFLSKNSPPGDSLNIYETQTGQLINSIKFKYDITGIYASKTDNTFAIWHDGNNLDIYKINNQNIELVNSIVLHSAPPFFISRLLPAAANHSLKAILDLNDKYIIIRTSLSVEKLNIRSGNQEFKLDINGPNEIKISSDLSKLIKKQKCLIEIWDIDTNKLIQTISCPQQTSDESEQIKQLRNLLFYHNNTNFHLNYNNNLIIINSIDRIMVLDNKTELVLYEKTFPGYFIEKLIFGNKSNFAIALTSYNRRSYYLNLIDLSSGNLIKVKPISINFEPYPHNSNLILNNAQLSQDDSFLLIGTHIYKYSKLGSNEAD